MNKVALIDTKPADVRNHRSVNLGLEIVSQKLKADIYSWQDEIPLGYKVLAYNVYYPMNIINMMVSWKRNRNGRRVIMGGQGVSNTVGLLDDVGEVFKGELDGDCSASGWTWLSVIGSEPIIDHRKAVIELTRGCKYQCTFCEYGNVTGGIYREKDIGLVKKQVDECVGKGVRNINFMSANFAGYKAIDELMEYCAYRYIRVLNSDVCLLDVERIIPWLERFKMRTLKIGLESLDEATRYSVKKGISDARLNALIDRLLQYCGCLHFYLIYGLPNDDYSRWMIWLDKLAEKRKEYTFDKPHLFDGIVKENTKNIRLETSITNFEPCLNTPLADAPYVDFEAKDLFIKEWLQRQIDTSLIKPKIFPQYKTAHGRIGRMENSYLLLMALKHGYRVLEWLLKVFPNGVGRSVEDKKAKAFLGL
tara:strand:- start:5628 stop:6887 length:1260 start_codon:yes stop_codon:yes gene_type:complete